MATPVFEEGTDGRLLTGGIAGTCVSLKEWHYDAPENVKDMGNYCQYPQPLVNTPRPVIRCRGGWDTANPPHKTPNFLYPGQTLTLFLGITATAGYLVTCIVASEKADHTVAEGGEFEFSAYQVGAVTRYPA